MKKVFLSLAIVFLFFKGVSAIDLDNPEHLAILGVPKIEVEALLT